MSGDNFQTNLLTLVTYNNVCDFYLQIQLSLVACHRAGNVEVVVSNWQNDSLTVIRRDVLHQFEIH